MSLYIYLSQIHIDPLIHTLWVCPYLSTGVMCYNRLIVRVNPLTAKLFNLNSHPLEVVSR